jgi:hypothetical protein
MLYESFADREKQIALMDARAGSPSAATELIIRQGGNPGKLEAQLAVWEEWASSMLETHLSYPMLSYFRSQHENQSWLGTLVSVLDACALILAAGDGDLRHQAELTFAMGRHTLADLVSVFRLEAPHGNQDRLPGPEFERVLNAISGHAIPICPGKLSVGELAKIRAIYEPFAASLSAHFLMSLPGWLPARPERDNWLRSSWERGTPPYSVSDPFREK